VHTAPWALQTPFLCKKTAIQAERAKKVRAAIPFAGAAALFFTKSSY
jgi:hypothetical protein